MARQCRRPARQLSLPANAEVVISWRSNRTIVQGERRLTWHGIEPPACGPWRSRAPRYRYTTSHMALPLSVIAALVALVVIRLFRRTPQGR